LDKEEISIAEYMKIVRKRIKFITTVVLSFVVLSIFYSFIAKKMYISDASILPSLEEERTTSLGALGGLASNFGLADFQNKNNSQLYPDIFKSRPIIFSLLEKNFKDPQNNNSKSLLDLLEIEEKNREKRLQKGYKKIIKKIKTNVNERTGVVDISVETDKNWLSKEIMDTLIDLFMDYNEQTRTSKARKDRIFIEEQLEKAEKLFNIAEEKLTEHRNKNRMIDDSPELQRERGRLQLEYEICRTNYVNFKNEYDMAALKEVKETPEVNILNTPIVSQYRSRPKRKLIVIVSAFIGLMFGIVGAFGLEYYYNLTKNQT